MPELGRFLEISIPSDSVRDSLAYYKRLGLAELATGDIRDYHYGVVSDGNISIGLHGGGLEEIALTFVRPELAPHARELRASGYELAFERLGTDQFHEAALADPDGHLAIMVEARTFSPAPTGYAPAPVIGPIIALQMSCGDLLASSQFWRDFGFEPEEENGGTDVQSATMIGPGIVIELVEARRPFPPALCCRPGNLEASLAALESLDIKAARRGSSCALAAPEGTEILLETD